MTQSTESHNQDTNYVATTTEVQPKFGQQPRLPWGGGAQNSFTRQIFTLDSAVQKTQNECSPHVDFLTCAMYHHRGKTDQLTNCKRTKKRTLNTQTVRDKENLLQSQGWSSLRHINFKSYFLYAFYLSTFNWLFLWSLINDCCISASCSQVYACDLVSA